MSERYSKLFTLPENLYATGSPVVIAAGALLKDNQTGKILAQLKLRNIGTKTIKAATVCVEPLDTVGKPLGAPVTYQYLDLHADRDADFGQKAPIALPDSATRSFAVSVVQAIFTDNSIWNADGKNWESLNRPVPLDLIEDSELAKQFRIEYGNECKNLLLEQTDLWYCVCGAVNRQEESSCHKCGKSLVELQDIDMEGLRKNKEERIIKERAEAEVARKKSEIAAAKTKKIGMISAIAVAILVVIVVAANAISGMVKENNAYKDALALMDAGQYEEAIAAFEAMDGYKDSVQKIQDCEVGILENAYQNALALMNQGQYQESIVAFRKLNGYKDSIDLITDCNTAIAALQIQAQYDAAEALVEGSEFAKAAIAFGKLGDYQDAKMRSLALWENVAVRDTLSTGPAATAALRSNGTVMTIGHNQCDISGWEDIIAVNIEWDYIVGLKSDGTVVVAMERNTFGQCNVSDWTDIVSISTGEDCTIGLKSDGTVVAVGSNFYGQCNVSDWADIVAVSGGDGFSVGLKSDGTVVAVGDNYYGQCDISDWIDIVAVSAGRNHTVALKSDGTVVAVGYNYHGQCDISDWTDIVAISAGSMHTVGLKSDGTVVAVGSNEYGRCDVSKWTDILAISARSDHTVGLKNDGTVVAVGYNNSGQCDVSEWTDILLP